MGTGLAVGTKGRAVEAGFALQFALRTAGGMAVGGMEAGASGTGWWLGAAELIMPKS